MKQSIDIKNMDLSAKPGTDFYEYCNGGWIKDHPLEGEFASFGVFDLLRENAKKQLKDLILGLGNDPKAKETGSIAQKVSDLYRMGLDVERLNREGAAPIKPVLEKIEKHDLKDMSDFIAWLHYGLSDVFFSSGVGIDTKDSSRYIYHFGETGLTLGDRDYYLEDNETNAKLLKGLEEYIVKIMTLAGYSEEDAARISETVIRLEKGFAAHKRPREERRNPYLLYNIFPLEDMEKKFPNFGWAGYLKKLGVEVDSVNITNPKFYEYLNELLPTLSEREIKDYILYNVVCGGTALLGEAFEDADFELFDRLMSGVEEKKPRWKKAMVIPNSMFGEAIGELYVEKYFPPRNKEYMKDLVENLREALATHIRNLPWMGEATKEKALEKLRSLRVKIGYPDKWKDYSGISIDPSKSYWENVFEAGKWFIQDALDKLHKPVDKEEWHMYPQTVNAYYSPVNNEICFPAAILQPPYFNAEADDALNYGAIGAIIGHEMTHGFDDQGRQFDKNGNLENWWTPDDEEKFKKLTQKLVDQFNKVEVAPGVYANGEFTLGENIADQGGLRVALTAYLSSLEGDGAAQEKDANGFTPLQRFYLSYAGVWAGSIREEEKLVRTKSDPHSLAKNRVNVTLRNISEFLEAFGITEGEPMYRAEDERVVIW